MHLDQTHLHPLLLLPLLVLLVHEHLELQPRLLLRDSRLLQRRAGLQRWRARAQLRRQPRR